MLNYRHLYYFWMVAKEGGFARAADRLQMAVQTISAQVRELEKSLGHQLLKPSGRGVALTEAGQQPGDSAVGRAVGWHLQTGGTCAAGARAGPPPIATGVPRGRV